MVKYLWAGVSPTRIIIFEIKRYPGAYEPGAHECNIFDDDCSRNLPNPTRQITARYEFEENELLNTIFDFIQNWNFEDHWNIIPAPNHYVDKIIRSWTQHNLPNYGWTADPALLLN